jgi:imidazolonepropionase-like amidohydrolase
MHQHVATGLCLVAVLCMSVGTTAQRPTANSNDPLALTNANVVNVRTGRIIVNTTIVLRNGKIESIGSNARPADTKVVDLKGSMYCQGSSTRTLTPLT